MGTSGEGDPRRIDFTRSSMDSLLALLLLIPGQQAAQDPTSFDLGRGLSLESPRVLQWRMDAEFLAHPALEGRLPGTAGMEIAKHMVEARFRELDLTPAFPPTSVDMGASYRQPFVLGSRWSVAREELELEGLRLSANRDFVSTGHGRSGRVEGDLVFVGYAANRPEADYIGVPDDLDLTGKVCMVLRFEPLDRAGRSRWQGNGWSSHATFRSKFTLLAERGAAAILLVDTPGADDPRIGTLLRMGPLIDPLVEVPVLHLSTDAAARICRATGQDLTSLRALADEAPVVQSLETNIRVDSQLRAQDITAENVGALIPGQGPLADEVVVFGAHLDHLGRGAFGSRADGSSRYAIHPGADDNASGVAGVLLIAEELSTWRRSLPPEQPVRSLLFLAFSAEESGLLGASHYVSHPIRPLGQHALMLNFDMIGRLVGGRLRVAGTGSAQGLSALTGPLFEESPLEIVEGAGVPAASDHWEFYRRQVPSLFGVVPVLHDDYHTPKDRAASLLPLQGVQASLLFAEVGRAVATRTEPLPFLAVGGGAAPLVQLQPATPQPEGPQDLVPALKVQFGIVPATEPAGTLGILVQDVPPDMPAAAVGVQAGDRLVGWDGVPLDDLTSWLELLQKHEPGDEVAFTIERGGERLVLVVKLQAKSR